MPVHPIIARLAAAESLPRQEIEACRADRESLVPPLLDTLRRIADDAADIELEEYEALFWIVHLLGEFGETAAFAPLIELVRDDPEWIEDDLDDAVTATLPGVLIRTFDGDYERLEGLIEDELADEFLRAAAFEAWIYLTAQGRIERDHAETYLRQCADYRLEPRDGCYVWSVWLSAAAYLGFADLADLVQTACDRRWIDPEHGTYADFQQMLARTAAGGEMTEHLHRDSIRPFTDTIAEFERWTFGPDDEPEASPFQPVINPYRHVGRNDPCPCGSGRKFKKCCGGITLH